MKKKYILIVLIIIFVITLLLLAAYRLEMLYKPSRLICVGEIKLNKDARHIVFSDCFLHVDRADFESRLINLSESDTGYINISQQEIDELVDAVNEYENYPTVIFSRVKSRVFWTRLESPHIGYMTLREGNYEDDVMYVYVTKCTEIEHTPDMWEFRYRDWIH